MGKSVLLLALSVLLILPSLISAIQVWSTSLDKSQLLARQGDISASGGSSSTSTTISLNINQLYQEIYGFGGSLTETAAINFINLKNANSGNYYNILNNFFNPNSGIGLSIVRVPISSTDMSNAPYYTYDENTNDWLFASFSFNRDAAFAIPVLKDILAINPKIKVLITPWTAPTWMKTSAGYSNAFYWGEISPRYYDDFAYYLQVTIQKFEAQGIPIFAVTPQNEPQNEPNSYPVMRVSVQDSQAIVALLGTKLQSVGLGSIKILVWDHNWDQPDYPIGVLQNSSAAQYVAGSAWHCYAGDVSAQSQVYNQFPNKEIWFTECSGTGDSNFAGNIPWNTNNLYIGAIQNWARTVLHWNLATDQNWGPKTSGGCENCRGFITVHSDEYTVDYNEEYYGIAQFSKFLVYPAYRAQCNLSGGWGCVSTICFRNADSTSVVVVANFCETPQPVVVNGRSSYISQTVPVGLTTFVW